MTLFGLYSHFSLGETLRSSVLAVALAASCVPAIANEYELTGLTAQQTFDGDYGQVHWWDLPQGWRSDTSIPSPRYDYANPVATQQSEPTGPNALTDTSPGGTYIFQSGSPLAYDRSLGILGGTTYTLPRNVLFGLHNAWETTLTSVHLDYNYEFYRDGRRSADVTLFWGYSASNVSTTSGEGGIEVAPGLDEAVHEPPYQYPINATLSGLEVPPGGNLYFRWCFEEDESGTSSQAIGIDDLSLEFTAMPVPDTQAPMATMQAPSPDIAAAGPVNIQVDYTDDVAIQEITLAPGDVTLHRTGTANATVEVNGSGIYNRTITLSNIAGDGTLSVSIPAGTATDTSGNQATAAASGAITVDNTPPSGYITGPDPTAIGGWSHDVVYFYTFDDETTMTFGFVWDEILTTGTVDASMGSGMSSGTLHFEEERHVNVNSGDGELAVRLPLGYLVDAAGNQSLPAGPSAPVTVDYTGPEISDLLISPSLTAASTSVTVSFTSSEPLCVDGTYPTHVRFGWLGSGYPYEAAYVSHSGNRYTYEYLTAPYYNGSMDISVEPFDAVNNYGWFHAENVLFVDTYPPISENFSASPQYAGLGDDVMITFDINDTVPTSPTVTVDGETAVCVSYESPTWTYRYTVDPAAIEGSRDVHVVATDHVGNVGTGDAYYLFNTDPNAPTFTLDWVSPPFVRPGYYCNIQVGSSESLDAGAVSLQVGDDMATPSGSGGGWHSFTFEPAASLPDGPLDMVAIGTDYCGNTGMTTFTAAVSVDNTPPVSSMSAPDTTVAGTEPFSASFVTTDGLGCGVSHTTLMVRVPGASEYSVIPGEDMVWGESGIIGYEPSAGSGRYAFVSVSRDNLGNVEAIPAQPDVVVVVNAEAPNAMTLEVPPGNPVVLVFPLSDDYDVTITLTNVTTTGTITVTRTSPLPADSEPDYFRNPADLLRESLTISAGGGLVGGFPATLEWSFALGLKPGKDINRVYRFEGALPIPTEYAITPVGASGKLRVEGIDGFSTWYAGNDAAVPVTVSGFAVE